MKNKFGIKLFTALVLLLTLLTVPVMASTFGNDLHQLSLDIAGDTELAKGVYWNYGYNDYISENYLLYQPGGSVSAMIGFGRDLYGAASLQTAVTVLTEAGYHVLAAINADFFNTTTGVPVGLVIFNGEILSSESSGWQTIGFKSDGSVVLGEPGIGYTLSGNFGSVKIAKVNKEMSPSNGVTLYTPAYSTTTHAAVATYNVVLSVTKGQLSVGGQVQGKVVAVQSASAAYSISEGQMVISLATSGDSAALEKLKAISVGDTLTINVSDSAKWRDVVFACGGSERLLSNGSNVASASTAAPRTALGVKADGSVLLYTVDGRQAGVSAGATFAETAARMAELGCVDAVNLDGGGSTTLGTVLPGNSYGTLTIINSPSGGALRSCGDYIFLVNNANDSGSAKHLHLYPYEFQVLAGSTVPVTIKATNANYYPVELPDEPLIDVPSSLGQWNNGSFVAAWQNATGTISASAGSAKGSVDARVLTTPDSIALYKESNLKTKVTSISLNAGESVDLKAVSLYQGMELYSSDDAYAWQVNGSIGSVNQSGVFTANAYAGGSGTVVVSAGGKTASISVTVTASAAMGGFGLLENFEDQNSFSSAAGITTGSNGDKTYVKYGKKSLRLDYDFSAAPLDSMTGAAAVVVTAAANVHFVSGGGYLTLWVYGDNSANQLTVTFTTASGVTECMAVVLNFSGWQGISVAVPADATGISAVNLRGVGKGTIYLDHLMLGTGSAIDSQAPVINITGFGNTQLTASVRDLVDSALTKENLSVTLDGTAQSFSYDSASGSLNATIVIKDANSHIISVIARDSSGNLGKASYTVAADAGVAAVFVDMDGHWGKSYTEYLYHQGIVSGIESKKGLTYQPDSKLTRAQFAVIMANWLHIDATAYASVEMPFADKASIPSWAANQVKAMYKLGVISGYGSGSNLQFRAGNQITRAEALTMIGRVQERGYGEKELSFSDAGDVPSWSLPFVKTLVSQGAIGGYNNKLLPNQPITRGEIAKIIYTLL